ncbi:MAG: DUF3786 domain-containing protein [Eubacteriaceae bacterium]|nr:DUF3786 domain-containing protein [Eubacteriaceae bacterium]
MAENRFEMMRDYWRNEFLKLDHDELISRFGLECDGEKIYITYYSRKYFIDLTDGYIAEVGHSENEVPFGPLMSIYHLFYFSKPHAKVRGEFVPFRNVKNASPFAPNFEKSVREGLAAKFDGKKDLLISACEKLGGRKIPQGDVGYIFYAFEEIMPVMMVFWDGDDEFPAQANILFDADITDFLHEETVCCIGGDLIDRLVEMSGM